MARRDSGPMKEAPDYSVLEGSKRPQSPEEKHRAEQAQEEFMKDQAEGKE